MNCNNYKNCKNFEPEPEPERAFQRLVREYIAQWTNNDKWKTGPWSELVEEWAGSIRRIRTFFNATLDAVYNELNQSDTADFVLDRVYALKEKE